MTQLRLAEPARRFGVRIAEIAMIGAQAVETIAIALWHAPCSTGPS